MAEERNTIEIEFTRAADYRIIAANGAWGGVAPNQMIVFDLYVERLGDPGTAVRSIEAGPEGSVRILEDEQASPGFKPKLVREGQVGVAMTPEAARALGLWLLSKTGSIEEIENAPELDLK